MLPALGPWSRVPDTDGSMSDGESQCKVRSFKGEYYYYYNYYYYSFFYD